ncbi:O-methyltransferase [Penicillium paradoxum]|uniref:O-methyltransferase n=1 Tax=Penicillium paradoxum TaxID=176176 RepID=UPI002548D4B3|nr:O-methyltransferase [Penicillium paradoxum]KAJ5794557.1 O-methyltransferase [Penicillium paradoxum]
MKPDTEIEQCQPTSIMERLGTEIGITAVQLSHHIQQLHYPLPSFDVGTPIQVLPSAAPQDAHELRRKLKRDALALFRLASGPSEYAAHLSMNHQYTVCLRYLSQFKVFHLVPREGSITLSDLAATANLPLDQLTTVLRMVATSGLFEFHSSDTIGHSATSLLHVDSPPFAAWTTCVSQYVFNASSQLTAATELWGNSRDPTHSPFNLAFNSTLPFGKFLADTPSIARDMGQFVQATEMVDSNDVRHLVTGYAWGQLEDAVIVDVNSASLASSIALAEEFPSLSFEVQPQEKAVAQINSKYMSLGDEFRSRITIIQPPADPRADGAQMEEEKSGLKRTHSGPKIFLFRHVLHNLPDFMCQSILKSFLPALHAQKPHGRILIMDLVLPEYGELDHYEEAMVQTRQMIQLELANGRGRSIMDWGNLVHQVESEMGRLAVRKVSRPPGSDLSILEIEVV